MTPRHSMTGALLAGLGLAALAVPRPALAWWRGGVFFGFPAVPYYYAPPPVVYPPPVIYAPPPAAYPPYAPPRQAGPACYAGPYVCPLEAPSAAGAPCSCPTNTGRIAGRVG